MEITRQTLKTFRVDFDTAVAELSSKYGVNINLGNIKFSSDEFRATMTVLNGKARTKLSKSDFKVGDLVTVVHKKIKPTMRFEITNILPKNISIMSIDDSSLGYTVSPGLLNKK